MKKDKLYLQHIEEAIGKIERYIRSADYGRFLADEMMTDAVIRQLGIIGEATNRLGAKLQKSNPQIPFRDIVDMRNFLIHDYHEVEQKIVWDTCKKKLPELKRFTKESLKKLSDK
jgi:uncharacterized protein with HEPN domain